MSHPGRNGQNGGPTRQARRDRRACAGAGRMARGTARHGQDVPAIRRHAGRARRAAAPIILSSRRRRSSSPPPPAPIAHRTGRRTRDGRGRAPAADGRRRRRPATPVLEPDVQVVRFQGPPGLDRRGACARAGPRAGRRRRRHHHRRPPARSRISPARDRDRRTPAGRAFSGHRDRRPPASARRHRPRQIPDPRRFQPGRPRRRRRSRAGS